MEEIEAGDQGEQSHLGAIRAAGEQLHRALLDEVLRVRLLGGSWTDVGQALGISRQAARMRFKDLDEVMDVALVVKDGRARLVSEQLEWDLPDPRNEAWELEVHRRVRRLRPELAPAPGQLRLEVARAVRGEGAA